MYFDTKLSYRAADDLSKVNLSQFTGNKKDLTFKIRYLVDDQYYNSQEAVDGDEARPILFFTGGESELFQWYNMTGF